MSKRKLKTKLVMGALVVLSVWLAVYAVGRWSVTDPASLAVAMGGGPEDAEIAGAFGAALRYGLPFMIVWCIFQFIRGGRSVGKRG